MRTENAVLALILSGFLFACAAGPASQSAAAPQKRYAVARANVSDKDETYVCHSETLVGSHIKKYVCLTPEEREQIAENSREAAQKSKGFAKQNVDPKFGAGGGEPSGKATAR